MPTSMTFIATLCFIGLVGSVSFAFEPTDNEARGCYCVGTVGNVNCDYTDTVSISDLTLLIDHLFITGVRLPNLDEANIDADPGGVIEMADVALLIDHLFISFPELPACPLPPNVPPDTRIAALISDVPFVDGPGPVDAVAGITLEWTAEDRIDHPYFPPPFEFEYRMYGPYTDSLLELVLDSFALRVFRTNTGELIQFGLPQDTVSCDTFYDGEQIDTIICRTLGSHYATCDTSWDGGVRTIVCDTVLIDTLATSTAYGRIDTLFDVEDPSFVANPDWCRIARASYDGGDVWTGDTTATIYDVFAGHHADTTQVGRFVFWVRARDPDDPTLHDPTPAFAPLAVIDPRFERDVLVLNWTSNAHENRVLADSVLAGWQSLIDGWADAGVGGVPVVFDPERDYMQVGDVHSGYDLLKLALRYKVLINHQDAAASGSWSNPSTLNDQVFVAIATGVNVWIAARVPLGVYAFGAGPATEPASADYTRFFGVEQAAFSGWASGLYDDQDGYGFGLPRVEHFVGAASENPDQWPDLAVDTTYLHHRYDWDGSLDPPLFPFYPFMPEIGALPEVGWTQPSLAAEVMYRYRSLYGEVHPINPELSYHGNPVMVRLDGESFRTVHSMFTPLALEETTAQQMVIAVLNWLYPSEPAPSSDRRDESGVAVTVDELRVWYRNWREASAVRAGRH